ncbi:hypothetical protein BKI52_15355 [marine bacterium AO1-C]|nr:hypothetical protein BKI52_15355 [marine bacterium AO1-C]
MQSKVQNGIDQETNQANTSQATVQKKANSGAKSTKQSSKPTIQAKQRPIQAKQRPIQAKQRPIQRNTGSGGPSGNVNEAQVKANVSALTGTDVTDAQVTYNSSKPMQLKAEATAQGNQVHLAPGKEQHLGHELTHVAQQKQGRVQPTIQANNGVGINNDPKLEKEADDIGAKAHNMQHPVQTKPISGSSSINTSQSQAQPMQLKYLNGKIKGTELVGVHKSDYKKVENNKGVYLFSERPTKVTVEDGTKATLKPGQTIKYDPDYKDKTGKYVRVQFWSGKTLKIGFVEMAYITRHYTKKEKEEQARQKVLNAKARQKAWEEEQRRLEEQEMLRLEAEEREYEHEKESYPEHIGRKANVGVEVEMRNITLTRADKTWDEDGQVIRLSKGGYDGNWVTDQHSGNDAVIEWNTVHPSFGGSDYGAEFQQKLEDFYQLLDSNSTGTLEELANLASGVMDIGDIRSKYKDITYSFNSAHQTNTQVNMEVPLLNIGRIPENAQEQAMDSAKMFSGNNSKFAKEVFIQSRLAANNIILQVMKDWKESEHGYSVDKKDVEEITSIFTIFLHSAIHNGMGGGKDPRGVLFKNGAGDLVRTSLNYGQKKTLWVVMHQSKTDYTALLAEAGKKIYTQVHKGRGGNTMADKIALRVQNQAFKAFLTHKKSTIPKYSEGNERQNYHRLVMYKKLARWGNEYKQKTYGDEVNTRSLVKNRNNDEFERTNELTGVATGKYFEPTSHNFKGRHISESVDFVLAEIRRNDNDINKLVKKRGISDQKRDELKQLIQGIQTPMT